MKVNIWQSETKKINNLFYLDECNKVMSEFNLFLLDNAKQLSNNYKEKLSFLDNIITYLDVESFIKENNKMFDLTNNFKKLDESKYVNNPYVKNIKLNNVIDGHYAFKEECFEAYECFIYDNIEVANNIEKTKIGYFDKKFKYISLYDNGSIWMLITPHEINTMEKAISKANGNVITFGLGLGYFAYMCSLKENVNSVTIIEKDDNIINLFTRYILPQFENKEKIKIIKSDALKYINKENDNYDYAFVDLYKDVNDGLEIYVSMLKQFKMWPKVEYDFWIEESMLIMIKRCILTLIYEKMNNIEYEGENSNYFDKFINNFDKSLKDIIIYSYDDILDLIDFNNIKKTISKL